MGYEEKIIVALTKKGELSLEEIVRELQINHHLVEKILAEMLDKDKIELVQKSRGNYYKLVEVKK